jgi:Enoyl-(Acyl carrier protein) reductase
MCDYSLHALPNRLAVEGEQLLLHRFPTGALGLASPSDLWTPAEPPDQTRTGWWSRVKSWLSLSGTKPIPAVCVPPGAQLVLRDIPRYLQQQLGVGDEENAISPGFINSGSAPEAELAAMVKNIPAGYVGAVSDVVAAVNFLLSDQAQYITGTNIHLSGGWGI